MSDNKLDQTPLAATVAQGQMREPELNSGAATTLREGSALYYATLKMDAPVRTQTIHALNLINTLSTCLTGVQEPSVAQTKLQWWNDEISRLALNEPRHPVTQQCAHPLAGSEHAQAQLTHIVDAATAARFDAPEQDSDWHELMQRDYTARLSVMQMCVGGKNDLALEAMAKAVAWVDLLSTLPNRIHHDTIAFPPSWYERFTLTRQDLRKHLRVEGREHSTLENADAIQALIIEAISCAKKAVDEAIDSPTYQQLRTNKNHRALAIWLQIRSAQLSLWQKAQPDLLRETMTLTPLRKWYIAFRHR